MRKTNVINTRYKNTLYKRQALTNHLKLFILVTNDHRNRSLNTDVFSQSFVIYIKLPMELQFIKNFYLNFIMQILQILNEDEILYISSSTFQVYFIE